MMPGNWTNQEVIHRSQEEERIGDVITRTKVTGRVKHEDHIYLSPNYSAWSRTE